MPSSRDYWFYEVFCLFAHSFRFSFRRLPAGGHRVASAHPHLVGGYDPQSVDPYPAARYRAVSGPTREPWASVDPHPPASFAAAPPPSRTETTTVWSLDDPLAYSPVTDTGRHHRRLAPAGW